MTGGGSDGGDERKKIDDDLAENRTGGCGRGHACPRRMGRQPALRLRRGGKLKTNSDVPGGGSLEGSCGEENRSKGPKIGKSMHVIRMERRGQYIESNS